MSNEWVFTNIHPVQKGHHVKRNQHRDDMQVHLPDQPTLLVGGNKTAAAAIDMIGRPVLGLHPFQLGVRVSGRRRHLHITISSGASNS